MSELHEHLSPEDLLELALEESSPRAAVRPAAIRACSDCSRALDEALAELLHIRIALTAVSPEESDRTLTFAEGIIARTTREDLSWRGDWRVVGRFLRERWSASLAVRLVAASLLIHLTALPVLAIALVIRAREAPRVIIKYEEPPVHELPLMQVSKEPRRELVREPEPDSPGPLSSSAEIAARSDRLVAARRQLVESDAPSVSPEISQSARNGGPSSRLGLILIARSQRLDLGGFDGNLSEPAANAPLLERALWSELLLDDWALSGRLDPRLAPVLERMKDAAALAREAGGGSVTLEQAQLALHALERAASYGFPWAAATPSTQPMPALDREWFQHLERACGAADLDPSGALSVWIRWGRERAR